MAVIAVAIPPTSAAQRPGASRPSATAPPNTHRYDSSWLAPNHDQSGCTDQMIDSAANAVKAANSATAGAPQAGPRPPTRTTATHAPTPRKVSAISDHVFGPVTVCTMLLAGEEHERHQGGRHTQPGDEVAGQRTRGSPARGRRRRSFPGAAWRRRKSRHGGGG